MKAPLKIANAQGFWGDRVGASTKLMDQQPDIDYITLDYLSEVSMSILAIQREKDPSAGYARDFLEVVRGLVPHWRSGSKVKIVTNAGGLAPLSCAKACGELLRVAGCTLKIGIVSGDDVLALLKPSTTNFETKEPLSQLKSTLVTANAYLGADGIVKALEQDCDIVITGRVADPSLTVGPCIYHFGWRLDEYNKIAGATVAGHLIECGTQVTGGISINWLELEQPAALGFPIAEISEDGSCVITKPEDSSGRVDIESVKEQLLYEIGDPGCYLSPDATVSLLGLQVVQEEDNRVRVSGAHGGSPPSTYKVSATYQDGYKAEALLGIFGPDAIVKAKRCGQMVLARVKDQGYVLERSHIECLGSGDIVPGVFEPPRDLKECVLRVCVADHRQEAIDCFAKEIAPLVTSGPQGVVGYTSGRPHVRQVFGYWPCLISRDQVKVECSYGNY